MNKIRPDCFQAGLYSLVSSKHLRVITLKLLLICKRLLCSESCLASLLAFPTPDSSLFGRYGQVLCMRTPFKNSLLFLRCTVLLLVSDGLEHKTQAFCISYTGQFFNIFNNILSHFLVAIYTVFFLPFASSLSNLSILSKDKALHSFLMQLYSEELYQELVWVVAQCA